MNYLFLIIALLTFGLSGFSQKKQTVIFYNVENLFDTLDGTNNDSEFLPDGKFNWTPERYNQKILHISRVLNDMNSPLFVGLCEVENAQVVRDVLSVTPKLNKHGLVHFESPDSRGIDVALVYDSARLRLLESGNIRFLLPGKDAPSTRDIVWGKFVHKKDTIFALVNHWPSRSGGQEQSEPNRIQAAQSARIFIDSLLQKNKQSKIVLMGDLNDNPSNKAPQLIAEKLVPMIHPTSGKFGGTYNYKGEWDILDHIYVSPGFLKTKKGSRVKKDSGVIHSFDYLVEQYNGNTVPFRTFGGVKYLGGYSDHLPVSVTIVLP
jgi:predicted extracellular nuclease